VLPPEATRFIRPDRLAGLDVIVDADYIDWSLADPPKVHALGGFARAQI
jgi:hypothetical protein